MIKLSSYICGLDIGSSKISACLLEIKGKRLSNIFFETAPSKGVKSGVIVDSIELVNAVSKLMKSLKARSGINVKYVYTNISGQDIVTKTSRAIVPLAERGNKVITQTDVDHVNDQARILGSTLEEEIIQIIPLSYTIDSKSNCLNPLGLYSHRLEVDLYLVCGRLSSIQSLARVVHQSGYDIKDVLFSGYATSRAVFGPEFKSGISFFCDIGSDITEILMFKDGVLQDVEILPIGGDNMTAELSETLKIPFELAEDIKRSHGIIGDSGQIGEAKEILVKKSDLYKPIKQRLVAEVITKSARDICARIKEIVDGKGPLYEVKNFVIVGRALLLEGFIEALENTLSIPVRLGRINDSEILTLVKENDTVSGQKYLNYLTAIGMVCEGLIRHRPPAMVPIHQPAKSIVNKAVNRFKEVYQEYF
jgi:cell division protein FtsA